ncbi:hypothetical protein [Salinispora sp. H7-4]|uniref:hypothetical protein n=1 Tax=Salinispora sp. H7-4 TaxID=2748321 RepID=UPI0015D34BB6|nr:hypothetical protein [Salinispora sp. H7-4]NYT96329.1 hypothetical protein [Salinispora sp. H7-4]
MPELITSGQRLTPARLNGRHYEETTTGFTVGSGLTLLNFQLRRTAGVCVLILHLAFDTASNLSSNGNLPDRALGTLPPGWGPTGQSVMWSGDTGYYTVTGIIHASNGVVEARAAVGDIAADTNLRLTATYIN